MSAELHAFFPVPRFRPTDGVALPDRSIFDISFLKFCFFILIQLKLIEFIEEFLKFEKLDTYSDADPNSLQLTKIENQ